MDVLKFYSRKSPAEHRTSGRCAASGKKKVRPQFGKQIGEFFPFLFSNLRKSAADTCSIYSCVGAKESSVVFCFTMSLSLSTVAMETIPTHCLFAESVKGESRQTSLVVSKITRWHLRSIGSSWWNNWTFARHQDSFSCRESQRQVSGTQRLRPVFLH